MIITRLRIQEEHPMSNSAQSWPLPSVDFNLDNSAGANGYILKDSVGLGPPALTAIVEGFDTSGTPIMYNLSEKRLITLKIGLTPQLGQSYGSLRDHLYRFISRSVYFKLMNETTVVAQTTGFIRNVEPTQFSNKPDVQITIECVEGDFIAPLPVQVPLDTLSSTLTPVINYTEGSAPTGLDMVMEVMANHTGFTISNHGEFWHAGSGDVDNQFVVNYPFVIGDFIYISTHPRSKRLTVLTGPTEYDIAGYINAGAIWPKLYTGVNSFEWDFDPTWMNFAIVTYFPRYWGV